MAKYVIKNRITEHLAIKARKEGRSNIPQAEIAEAIGITQHSISLHMRNKVSRYELTTIESWCQYLDITPADFFTWEKIEEGSDEDPQIETPLLESA